LQQHHHHFSHIDIDKLSFFSRLLHRISTGLRRRVERAPSTT
jgi:hypothetical protein